MLIYFRNSLVLTVLCLCIGFASARSSISDGELVVTVRDGRPCYFYPADEYTKNEPFFFRSLSVSWNDRLASLPDFDLWETHINSDGISPSSSLSCLEYGVVQQGALQDSPAKPHKMDVPYRVHLSVYSRKLMTGRKYQAFYCLSRNKVGEPIIRRAEYSSKTQRYECLGKPDGLQ